jgi:dTDP-4-dehydrorhamnose 3,5-epimerase
VTAIEPLLAIDGVQVAHLVGHTDARGSFVETYRREWFPDGREMVQSNRAVRAAGSLVGLHFHRHQADYWHVTAGSARIVLHDLRRGSATEGVTWAADLADDRGVYIPPGVAHGFAATTDVALTYLVDRYYDPADELGVAWDDPAIGADWGIDAPVLSARDQANPTVAALDPDLRPVAP